MSGPGALLRITHARHCPGLPLLAVGRRLWAEASARRAPDRRFALSSLRPKTLRNRKSRTLTTHPPAHQPGPQDRGVQPGHGQPADRHRARPGARLHVLRAGAGAGPRGAPVRAVLAALAVALVVLVLAPLAPAAPASASTQAQRLTALRWAERQAGKWYCMGGTGGCFDCSGLVMMAYRHAGKSLPRTTYGMLARAKLRRIPASSRRRGDLAFYGSGHVELVTAHGTFGAHGAGTRVGWHHPNAWWHPTMYFRVR